MNKSKNNIKFNGKNEGKCVIYHPTGNIWYVFDYIDNKLNGEYKIYNSVGDGKLAIIQTYKNNIAHGKYIEYYNNSNGNIKKIYNYKNGIRIE